MRFLPIVERELRVASRRTSTYLLRTIVALVALVVGTWFFLVLRHEPPEEISMAVFVLLTGAAGFYCLLSGVRWTADCLSQEKRDGTLGLLFLTDLKGYDVVLGKLAANSLGAVYGFMAILPVFSLALLLGGVTFGEVARTALVSLNTMLFSLSVGLCVSSLSQSGRKATSATFLVVLLIAGVLPALGAWGAFANKLRSMHPFFFWASPGFTYFYAFDVNYRGAPGMFWRSLATTHALAWAALISAAVIAPRSWQDRPAAGARATWREFWKNWTYGPPRAREANRRALLDVNPFLWLCSRSRLKPISVWTVLGLLGGLWMYGYYKLREDWLNEGVYFFTCLVLNVLMKGWLASECGRQLAEGRHQGSLELLLATPLTVRDILRGQWLSLRRQFVGPLVCICVVWLAFLIAVSSRVVLGSDTSFWVAYGICGLLMLFADLYAIYWVGMWQGVTSRNPNRVPGETAVRILVVPWILIAGSLLLVALSSSSMSWQGFLMLWVVCGAVVDLGFGSFARNKLLLEFREAATRRYSRSDGFWSRLFGGGPKDGFGSV